MKSIRDNKMDYIETSLSAIRKHVETLDHVTKHMTTKAVRIEQFVERPDMELWAQPYKLHERAHRWAKKHMIASVCSLWQVHQTIREYATKEGRIKGGSIRLTMAEAEIMGLMADVDLNILTVFGKLPRFFA